MSLIGLLLLVFLWALSALLTVTGVVGILYSRAEYQFHMLRIKVDELTIEKVRVRRRGIRVFTGFPYTLEGRRIMGVKERWIWRRVFRLNTDKALPQRTRFLLGKYNRWDGKRRIGQASFLRKKNKKFKVRLYGEEKKSYVTVLDNVADVRDGNGDFLYVSFTFIDKKIIYGCAQYLEDDGKTTKTYSVFSPFSHLPFGLSR